MATDEFIWHIRATLTASERHKIRIESLESFLALPGFEWVPCGIFHKESGDWGFKGHARAGSSI